MGWFSLGKSLGKKAVKKVKKEFVSPTTNKPLYAAVGAVTAAKIAYEKAKTKIKKKKKDKDKE